ncbi:PAP2 superfamily-domain-containing protein [Lophiotrema nucula]|uniref:PAP2 superfamily-domain-containing protein n=1 Tax=Lophiotrema nucula TaxID=690887 RepID=A0A6A5YSW5_9PLEO|nr:PAP2 superfamily-domain-containing protein [Lophiotrema nucula]
MSALRNVLEPGGQYAYSSDTYVRSCAIAIVLIFTAGALLNRRRKSEWSPIQGSPARYPSSSKVRKSSRLPDNTIFHNNISSRFLSSFPFLIEIWYWNLSYWVYQSARAYSAHLIRHDARVHHLAEEHALSILRIEHCLGIDVELRIQQIILEHAPWLVTVLATIYYSHIMIGVCFIVYIYKYLRFGTFARIRRTIAMDNLLAFIILTAWRCKPPRLMPMQYGYIDVLHPRIETTVDDTVPGQLISRAVESEAPSTWNNNSYQLTIAAMPSLHFGTSLFLAISIMRYAPHRPLRTLAPLWPACMLLTILATANHWVLDAVVGASVPFFGWRLNRLLENRVFEAIEAWSFWLLRMEKPLVGSAEDGSRGQRSFRDEESTCRA